MVPSVLLVASTIVAVGVAYYPCVPCRGAECNLEPQNCNYGVERVCGRKVCAKGPGERCGGYHNLLGKCGEGLYCDNCGFCKGCYRPSVVDGFMECYKSDLSKCNMN